MKTNLLIQEIAKDVCPVQRMASPIVRFARWMIPAIFCLGVGVSILGVRENLGLLLSEPLFLLQAVLALALGFLSALSAFLLSVPDARRPWVIFTPVFTAVAWLILIFGTLFSQNAGTPGSGFACVFDIAVLSAVPGALLFFMLSRAAPLSKGKVGAFAAVSVAALGAFGTQLICHDDSAFHILVWHLLPVAAIGSLGIWMGKMLLAWDKR